MRISSSWLTLGASLSLLIPAWTANAQEFTIPLTPIDKVVLEPDTRTQIVSKLDSETISPQEIEIIRANSEVRANPELSKSQAAGDRRTTSQNSSKSPVKIAAIPEISNQESIRYPLTSTEVKNLERSLPKLVSSSTEPARVIPSSAASTSGQLDPAQTLVVPTTPSQVKLVNTKEITLQEVIELVERSSPDWIQAKINVERARAVLQEALAGRSPTVTGTVQYSYSDSAQARLNSINNNTPLGKTTSNPLSGTVGINYTLFDSGTNDTTIRIAENNLRIAESALNQARQTIRLSIVTAYYSLQNTDETKRIQSKAVENAEKSLNDTQSRERAGIGTKFDVLQSEVQLANARQALLNADAAHRVARRELSRQINYPPTVEIKVYKDPKKKDSDQIVPVAEWTLSLEETILLAVRNRAELDIRRLEREVARDRATNSLAKLGPQVNLFANVNTASEFTSGGGIGTGYQIGATLNWTLYDGGRAIAQVDQFKADQSTAESKFEQAARQSRYDVEESYINQESRWKQIATATKALQQAEEALRLARLRLDAGVGTQLEVITAETDLTRADVNRVQAIIGYNQSRANLERAINGL